MRTVCIRVSKQTANALANDNLVRKYTRLLKSLGNGITPGGTGYSTCVSGMPKSFVSSPAMRPLRWVLQ